MIKKLKERILSPKMALGIELNITPENSYLINAVLLEVKKGIITITRSWYNISTLSDLKKKLPDFTPVSLVINGKGLIHKNIPAGRDFNEAEVLPGVNSKDFLYELYRDKNISEVAIIRKSIAEKIINDLNEIGLYTVSLSMAFYGINYIMPIINHSGFISTNQYKLHISNGSIDAYESTNSVERNIPVKEEINVGTDYIKGNFIIAYGAALNILSNKYDSLADSKLETLNDNIKKIRENINIKFYCLTILFSFFILLLINFFIYNSIFSKNLDLLSRYQFSQMQVVKSDSQRIKMKEIKFFLSDAGWLNTTKMISFYADRIASTVPDSITLTALNINPASAKMISNLRQWKFQQDTIIITGVCNDPSLLDLWQSQLSEIKNIKEAKISSYYMKKQEEGGVFTAEVLIK